MRPYPSSFFFTCPTCIVILQDVYKRQVYAVLRALSIFFCLYIYFFVGFTRLFIRLVLIIPGEQHHRRHDQRNSREIHAAKRHAQPEYAQQRRHHRLNRSQDAAPRSADTVQDVYKRQRIYCVILAMRFIAPYCLFSAPSD